MKLVARLAATIIVTGLFGMSGAAGNAQAAPPTWCAYQSVDGSCHPPPTAGAGSLPETLLPRRPAGRRGSGVRGL